MNRLTFFDYSRPGRYFVTLVTEKRFLRFGTVVGAGAWAGPAVELNDLGTIVESFWKKLPEKFPEMILDEFVIMPNHVHGIIEIVKRVGKGPAHGPAPTRGLPKFMHWFKTMTTNAFYRMENKINPGIKSGRLWQVDYFENIIRSPEKLKEKREYIRANPEKWHKDRHNA